MDPKWIQVLVLLLVCHKTTLVDPVKSVKAKKGDEVSIKCTPPSDKYMVIWFRVLDSLGMEFLASASSIGFVKYSAPSFSETFKLTEKTLILKSFEGKDSGIYSCASLVGGNKLEFGDVTKLELVKETQITTKTPQSTMQPTSPTKTCDCPNKDKTGPSMFCAPIILGPLAGGCGLLLLLLIISTLYCNKMRTRRCPHHHRRKPRMDALEKQMMVNRHV